LVESFKRKKEYKKWRKCKVKFSVASYYNFGPSLHRVLCWGGLFSILPNSYSLHLRSFNTKSNFIFSFFKTQRNGQKIATAPQGPHHALLAQSDHRPIRHLHAPPRRRKTAARDAHPGRRDWAHGDGRRGAGDGGDARAGVL